MNRGLLRVFTHWYRATLRNPHYRPWIILGTLVYLFSPFDLAPDFFLGLGQIDDLAVLTLLFTEVFQMIRDHLNPKTESDTVANGSGRTGETDASGPTIDVAAHPISDQPQG